MITPAIAVNTRIKPSLVKDFGIALSTLIILQCSKKCSLMISNLDSQGYAVLVEAISTDYRVAKTLGQGETELRKKEWLSAIG